MPLSQIMITVVHALVGWGLCGATMGIGLAKTSLNRALLIHALAAPIIFTVVAWIYFANFGYLTPLGTAIAFVGIVIGMDLIVVALLVQRSVAMFRSIAGTWLPFTLIFASTYVVGILVRR